MVDRTQFLARWLRHGVHLGSLLAAAAPFVLAAVLEMARGWRPASDDAVITYRAWHVWSAHPPLVGQFVLTSGHARQAYDLGPGLYWLLSLPVHLDPTQGALWGAALLSALAAAACVQIAWSVKGPGAAILTLGGLLLLVAARPLLATDPVWNPNVGLMWFVAAGFGAWAVASGRMRWWPLQVFAASLAAQCHLEYALGAVLCCLVAPVVGQLRRRRFGYWLPAGLLVGALCWLAPLIQQFTAPHGNMSNLLNVRSKGADLGIGFGLRMLASVVQPPTVWQHGNQVGNFLWLMGSIGSRSPGVGIAVLAGLLLVVGVASWAKRVELAALALVVFLLAGALVVTFSAYPQQQLLPLVYLDPVSWPIGLMVWAVGLWSVLELVQVGLRRILSSPGMKLRLKQLAVGTAFIGTMCGAVVGGGLLATDASQGNYVVSGWGAITGVRVAVAQVDCTWRPGNVTVLPTPSNNVLGTYAELTGTIWQLYSEGWRPTTSDRPTAQAFGFSVAAQRHSSRVVKVAFARTAVLQEGSRQVSLLGCTKR